jgi:hypothetical protein
MPSPSKIKGSGWEKEVADFMCKLYNESFLRTPSSGAYVGGKNAHRKEFLHEGQIRAFKGDIIPPLEWKYFNSEAKFYKDFTWHQLYTGKSATIDKWIGQVYDAADIGDLNIMFLKFNRQGKFVAVEKKIFEHLNGLDNYMQYSSDSTNSIWIISEFTMFFKYNSDSIKAFSTQGVNF